MVCPFPLFGHVYKLNGLQAEQEELNYYGLDWSFVVIGHPLVVASGLVPKLSDKCSNLESTSMSNACGFNWK